MKLLIDKDKLELLLEKKREFIGNKVALDTIYCRNFIFIISIYCNIWENIRYTGQIYKRNFLYYRNCICHENSMGCYSDV